MSIYRQPYERHSYRGALDSGLVYYLLKKYSVKNQLWLDQFHGGEVPEEVATQLGLRWEKCDLNEGQDARQLEFTDSEFDGVLSHPPYWTAIKYSDDERDLSNCSTFEEFTQELGRCMDEAERVLQPGGYLIVIVGDVRRDRVLYPVHSDVIQHNKKFINLVFRETIIWEITASSTPFKSTKHMLMGNYCLIWEKLGHDITKVFE